MCYRFQQDWPNKMSEGEKKEFEDLIGMLFGLEEAPKHTNASNVAPTDLALVVSNRAPRQAEHFRFFLIPSFAKDRKYYDLTLGNARDDNVAKSKLFAPSFRSRRCIVPVSGYYEFLKTGTKKTDPKIPYVFSVIEEPMFGLAGIWDTWKDLATGEVLTCFAIITTEPNELAAPIHNRMPVILDSANFEEWLNPEEPDIKSLQALLKPFPTERMERRVFSDAVKNSKNKEEGQLLPVGVQNGSNQKRVLLG